MKRIFITTTTLMTLLLLTMCDPVDQGQQWCSGVYSDNPYILDYVDINLTDCQGHIMSGNQGTITATIDLTCKKENGCYVDFTYQVLGNPETTTCYITTATGERYEGRGPVGTLSFYQKGDKQTLKVEYLNVPFGVKRIANMYFQLKVTNSVGQKLTGNVNVVGIPFQPTGSVIPWY